jgi:hypothetical protein
MVGRNHEGLRTLLANGHHAKVHSNVPLSQIDECRPWRSALVVIVGGARGSRGGGAKVSITTVMGATMKAYGCY